jgi:ATP-binding cassette subfamily B (MDR/TAP) protein 1
LSEKANFKLENGRSRSSSTSRTIAADAGTETPPVKPNEHSSQIKSKRPDPHMLYSGRGSTYGRMDHNVEAPHTLAGTTDATHPDVIAHTGSSSSVNEKEVAVSHDRPDPLKPKHYGKAALLRNYGTVMKDRKWFFAAGILASIAAGAGWPLEGWMVGEAVDVLQIEGDNNAVRSGANKWALWFLVLAIADFAVLLFNGISFELTSERVVRNLKRDGMAALLRQEVGFFESSEETDAGALTSAITSNPADITSATGLVLSQIIVAITNLLGSTILGFTLSWKITVVALPPILVTFFSGWLNVAMLDKYESKNSGPAARCASFLSETVDVIRTVTNLGYQRSSMRSFEKHNVIAQRSAFFLNLGSIGFSISQSMIILLQALLFYWGGRLVSQNELSIVALYASFEAIIIASFASSRLLLFVGDVGRAFTAMAIVKSWYDRKPLVAKTVQDASVTEKMTHGREIGDIVISHVELRYPRRPEHPALKDVSLTIQSGKTHAFCGSSGSGKSSKYSVHPDVSKSLPNRDL